MTQSCFGNNPLKRLSHPPRSLDIFPSDFCLYGKIKGVLIVREILNEIDLLEAVSEILNGIGW
jgi:hypothetical protein